MRIWFLNAIGLARNMKTVLSFLMSGTPMMAIVAHSIHCRCLNNCKFFFQFENIFFKIMYYMINLVLMVLNLKLDKKIFMMTLVKTGWIWSIKNWHHPIILSFMTLTLFVNGIWQQRKETTFLWILNILG